MSLGIIPIPTVSIPAGICRMRDQLPAAVDFPGKGFRPLGNAQQQAISVFHASILGRMPHLGTQVTPKLIASEVLSHVKSVALV